MSKIQSKNIAGTATKVHAANEMLDAIAARDQAEMDGDSKAHLAACNTIILLNEEKKKR